jgi:hypothetical protein
MMDILHVHPDLHERMGHIKRQEALRSAQAWRLARLATAQHPGWFRRQECWLLCQLGRAMVRLGRRLLEYGTPQAALGRHT